MFSQVCVCPQGGGGAIPACIAGGIPACLAAGLQVGVGGGIPACLAGFQAHTQGGSLGDLAGGGVSRPTAKGEVEGDLAGGVPALGVGGGVETPLVTATSAGGTHPSGMHSC